MCCRVRRKLVLHFLYITLLTFSLLSREMRQSAEHAGKRVFRRGASHAGTGKQMKILTCGYSSDELCRAVFPEYSIVSYNDSYVHSDGDLLLIGMHGGCSATRETFEGVIIYINPEAYVKVTQLSESYYLGAVIQPTDRVMQFYYVSYAALVIPGAYDAFKVRPMNSRSKFLVHVSSRCLKHREDAFDLLASIDSVYAGGKCHGSSANFTELPTHRHTYWAHTHNIYSDFKFGLVMENTRQSGYITEKILSAFVGGTVPIYFGTEEVFNIFNKKAMIYYNSSNPNECLEYVKHVHANLTAYEEMLRQPILAEGAYDVYFSLLPGETLATKIRSFVGIE